jgi:hypothetical protein
MKFLSALLLSIAAVGYAADPPAQPGQAAQPPASATQPPAVANAQSVKKMGAVTWDPEAHKLRWTVQSGTIVNGQFVRSSEDQYEISPDEATMGNSGEKRGLDSDEAEGLNQLLDILSLYCAESVMWWDQGPDQPSESKPVKPDSAPPQKPVKVQQPAKPVAIPAGASVAPPMPNY